MDDKDLLIEEYRELMRSINSISDGMATFICKHYFDQNKTLFNVFIESFSIIQSICVLVDKGHVFQTAALLRALGENVSTINVLIKYKELQEVYKRHIKFRFNLRMQKSSDQRKAIVEHFKENNPNLNTKNALNFIDYGWIASKCNGEYGMRELMTLAELEDIYEWVDTLNMYIHGTITFANMAYDVNLPIIIGHNFIDILAKLVDYLCVQFHNTTNYDFVVNGIKQFDVFREAYKKIPDPTNLN